MVSSSNDLLAEGPPLPQTRIRNDRAKRSAKQNELKIQKRNQVLAAVGVEETNMKSRRLALAVAEKESQPPTKELQPITEGEEMSGGTTEDEDEKRERLKRQRMRVPLGIPLEDLKRITAILREEMKPAKTLVKFWTDKYKCDVANHRCSKETQFNMQAAKTEAKKLRYLIQQVVSEPEARSEANKPRSKQDGK